MTCATSIALPARCMGTMRRQLPRPVGLPARGVDIGLDDAGPHRIDANALGRHFARQPQGEGVNGAFARGIVHILARPAQPRRRTRQVDDAAAGAAMARAHAPDRLARADKTAQRH